MRPGHLPARCNSSNATPIRRCLRQTTRQGNVRPSLGKTSVNCSGMPTGLATSSATPSFDTLRIVQSSAATEFNRSGLEYPIPIGGSLFDHDLPLRSLRSENVSRFGPGRADLEVASKSSRSRLIFEAKGGADHGAVTLSPCDRQSSGTASRRRHADANVIAGCPPWFQPITSRKNCGHK